MFPQQFQSIFLTVLSLVVGGYIFGSAGQPEPAEVAVPVSKAGSPAISARPPLSSVSLLNAFFNAAQTGGPGLPLSQRGAGSGPPWDTSEAASEAQGVRAALSNQHPTREYTAESLDYFSEIGFGVEYGGSAEVLHRWAGDVKIRVHGSPTRADLESLKQITAELNELLGDMQLQLTHEEGNLDIYFLPESQFAEVEPHYMPVNLGFFRVWWDGAGAIHKARILVASQGITQSERSHLIREELTQSLGLFKDSWRYPDSMFYQGWTDVVQYSDLDRDTIRLLYHPRLKPGMTPGEARNALGTDPCCRD